MRGRCDLIALIEDVSPLGVAQDHPLHTHITDHLRTAHDGRYGQIYTMLEFKAFPTCAHYIRCMFDIRKSVFVSFVPRLPSTHTFIASGDL